MKQINIIFVAANFMTRCTQCWALRKTLTVTRNFLLWWIHS